MNLDGTNAAQVTVNVSTTARSGAGPQPESWLAIRGQPPVVPFAVWLMGLITLMTLAALRRRRACVGFAVSMLLVVLWVSCGGGGGGGGSPPPPQTGTPAGTYTLSVTATALGVSKPSITLTLKVN